MTSPESFAEQLSRLRQMATAGGEGEVWDLSHNDQLAIAAVLHSHDTLVAALMRLHDLPVDCSQEADRAAWDCAKAAMATAAGVTVPA